jgi:hypothetical protein
LTPKFSKKEQQANRQYPYIGMKTTALKKENNLKIKTTNSLNLEQININQAHRMNFSKNHH